MEGNGGINIENLNYYEQPRPHKSQLSQLGLQLMPTMADKPIFGGGDREPHAHHHQYLSPQMHPLVLASMNGGPYHHHRVGAISGSSISVDYIKDAWYNHGGKHPNVLPNDLGHHPQLNYVLSPEASLTHSIQLIHQQNLLMNENQDSQAEKDSEESERAGLGKKKRGAVKSPKSPKAKRPKRTPKVLKEECTRTAHRARIPKRRAEAMINGVSTDISGLAIPVCTCTGSPQQCYRWGAGGWQSACCTTNMSKYPLPMSEKRRSARIAGRKMSLGAFRKVLEKLSAEGYNFSNPIDLKSHWAKHGTNKFVTIR